MSAAEIAPTPAEKEFAARDEVRGLVGINDAHGALLAAIAWADNVPDMDTVLLGTMRAAAVALETAIVQVRDAREAQGLECPV
jgi:hypothetical protein